MVYPLADDAAAHDTAGIVALRVNRAQRLRYWIGVRDQKGVMTAGGGLLRAASCYFDRILEANLRSGLARKGDLVFFNPYSPYVDDCHIGFSGATLRAIIYFGIVMASGIASQG